MANAQLSNEPKNVQNGDLEMNQRHQNNLMKYLRHPVYQSMRKKTSFQMSPKSHKMHE